MIKVLHIVDLSKMGGVEVMFMHFISKAVKWQNYEHYVFCLRINSKRKTTLERLGITLFCPSDNSYNLFYRLSLVRIIKKHNIDIIYGQNFSGSLWGGISKLFVFNKSYLVCHEHGSIWSVNALSKPFFYFWVAQSDKILANSNAAAIMIKKRIFKKEVSVIHNGVVIKSRNSTKVNPMDEFFKIIFIGRITDIKGVDTLFEVAKIVLNKNKLVRFIFVGSGDKLPYLKEKTKMYELSENIIFTGIINDVSDLLLSSHLLILPSIREPLGNVLIEAGLAGIPSIASRVDGIPEIVDDGTTGFLIDPTIKVANFKSTKFVVSKNGELVNPKALDPYKIAEKINILINDLSLRNRMGKNAMKKAKNFTIKKYVANIKKTFDLINS